MLPTFAAIALGSAAVTSLTVYLLLIAAAAYAGGSSIAFLSLGHRRMQVLLSITGGIMLGVGLLMLSRFDPRAFGTLRGVIVDAGAIFAGLTLGSFKGLVFV